MQDVVAAPDAAVPDLTPSASPRFTTAYALRLREENDELLREVAFLRSELQAARSGTVSDELWAFLRSQFHRIYTLEIRHKRNEVSRKTIDAAWADIRQRVGNHLKGNP